MKIEITNLQTDYKLDEDEVCRYATWVMEQVQDLDPSFHWSELSLVLTDDAIRQMNYQWFGKDTVTDVISFAYPASGSEQGDTGEVIVNLQQAVEEGKQRESADTELALYIAHGCHHLMGATDTTPEEKHQMLTLEQAWVTRAETTSVHGPFFL